MDGQPYDMYFDNTLMFSFSWVASHTASAVKHSKMFLHVSIDLYLCSFWVSLHLYSVGGSAWIDSLLK